MEVVDVILALDRMPPDERRAYLVEVHAQSVLDGRDDVAEFVAEILGGMADRSTPDGRVRSRCVDKACGQAWVADKGSPLPTRWASPLQDCYRYAGAVGTRSDDPRLAFPAIRMGEPEPEEVDVMEFGRVAPIRTYRPNTYATVEYHDPHLIEGIDGEFVLVVDDVVTGVRVAIPRARHVQFDGWTPRGKCASIRADLAMYPTADGERFRVWAFPDAAGLDELRRWIGGSRG